VKGRKTEITHETYEVLVIRQSGTLNRGWCPSCRKRVTLISLNDASRAGLSIEAAQQQMEAGRLHLIEMAGGLSFVCLASLVADGFNGATG
jgi:hypothetical protein